MRRYNRSEHIYFYFLNRNEDTGSLEDCDSGYPIITITDPKAVVKINGIQMAVHPSTGEYGYWYLAPAAGGFGCWNVEKEGQTDGKITILKEIFELQ